MKKLFLLLIIAFALTNAAFSQTKQDDIKKMLKLLQIEKSMDAVMNSMLPMMRQQAGKAQDEATNLKIDEFMEFFTKEFKLMMDKMINDDFVKIYDKHFTHEDIKDIIKFYESPSGKKYIEKTPELTTETAQIMMTKYMPVLQEKIKMKMEKEKSKK